MPRLLGLVAPVRQHWFGELCRAQRQVDDAQRHRDEVARDALAYGLGCPQMPGATR